jgi:predicted ATP-grasp superfamily ATP-dependent carboligase
VSQKRVLVTDGETRAALAVTRGLADAGFEVAAIAVANVRPAAAHWSRSVAQRIPMPDPLTEEAGFLAALERTLRAGDFSVLLPGSDASLLSVSGGRHRLDPHVRIGLPAHENVQRSLDKTDLVLTAARHGLSSPPTVICHSSAQALEAADEIGFPVVAKPLSSIIADVTPRRRSGSVLAADAVELRRAMTTFGGSGIVQQHIRGGVVSFAGVFAGGRLLAEAVSRYHRTWHPTAGNACYSQTIEAPAILRQRVAALLNDLDWQGLFELELIDRGDGTWHAIDLNPRAYGSLALAIGAGANLPAIWCRHLLGSDSAPVKAVPGVFYRWTEADLRHALWQLRNGRGAAAAEVLNLHRGVVHPYLRSGDPGPGVARMLELGCKAAKRGRPSRRRAPDRSPTVIIGAGPNGLAAAAHLREAGIDARCFGEPLASWSHQMPAGMLLRSRRRSSHIADPQQALTIDDYEQDEGLRLSQPNLKLEEFIDYSRWFQQRAVPDLDTRKVTEVGRRDGDFGVRLDDGEELRASRVIVAAGLSPFVNHPAPFAALPRSVCSHTHEHNDLGGFTGRRVAVVGSGQSALECAALLNEASATVEVLARAEAINWLDDGAGEVASPADRRRRGSPISPPPTDVGGPRDRLDRRRAGLVPQASASAPPDHLLPLYPTGGRRLAAVPARGRGDLARVSGNPSRGERRRSRATTDRWLQPRGRPRAARNRLSDRRSALPVPGPRTRRLPGAGRRLSGARRRPRVIRRRAALYGCAGRAQLRPDHALCGGDLVCGSGGRAPGGASPTATGQLLVPPPSAVAPII